MKDQEISMRDIMIDIETLGTVPGSAIISIGAVAFDARTALIGDDLFVSISPTDAVNAGLSMDPKTVSWWMTQSDAARAEAFAGTTSLQVALVVLGEWIIAQDPERVWAKPPMFDLTLLEAAYGKLGMQTPWHYRTPRELRTLLDLSGVEIEQTPNKHRALDDAMVQANAVIDSYRRLGLHQPA